MPVILSDTQLTEARAICASLPALTGTDKQVDWARTIRAEYVSELIKSRDVFFARFADAACTGKVTREKADDAALNVGEGFEIALLDMSLGGQGYDTDGWTAKYWIDGRGSSSVTGGNALLADAAKRASERRKSVTQ